MTTTSEWEQLNQDYLADGLAWLRSRLDGQPPEQDGWWADPRYLEADIPPALEILAARLQLTRFEASLLMMCVAVELDAGMPRLLLGAGAEDGAPTFALALGLLPGPAWEVVSPHSPLRHWRLVRVQESGSRPLTSCPLQADERIVNYVKGLNDLDDRLSPWLRLVPDRWGKDLLPSHEQAVAAVQRAWDDPAIDERLPVVDLVGPDARVRRSLAAAAAGRACLQLQELAARRLPGTSAADLADLVRLLDRESRLLPLAFYLDVSEVPPDQDAAVSTLCTDLQAPLVLGSHEPYAQEDRRTRIVDARRPTGAEQERLWTDLLGPASTRTAVRLADHFDLDPTTIRDCAAAERRTEEDTAALEEEAEQRLWDACRDQARPQLAALARRVEPQKTWDDLVLAPPELEALHALADQVRGRPAVLRAWGAQDRSIRGEGITALFTGQSGTGKTLAAEVLAADLRLTLYRIDLSGVVSKYIGETERNLRRVFDAAEQGGALLFFDEADALFGKRSEVRDSHDRYANIEVNYLLQRMEDYRGLAVLATNQRRALDTAFLRRLRMVLDFPFPSTRERHALWQRAFAVDPAGLDLGRLAELPATGGMIRNIALNAACCAAGQETAISMPLVLAMAQQEFRKLDLPLPEASFAERSV